MSAVRGLGLNGGIPPRVEMDNRVGAGEVEAGATRFERDQENGYFSGLIETIHFSLPSTNRHRTIQVAEGNFLVLEFGLEESEKRSELGKNEQAMAVVHGL